MHYPAELPITERREEILAALRDHQVVVVAGETGSGKSTQLPKLCLEAGLGELGMIGHTQPRRIAARTVAERIASELGEEIGNTVGYTVRFTDKVRRDTRVRVMTDGILLNELQRDRKLSKYSTIIVDEAHERSLNIDFILGYLRQLLPRRPDLKVVVTSATIDTQRFAEHFADADGNPAPIIEVSGRTYPVEVRYRPLDEDTDPIQGIADAIEELQGGGPGDVLVFLSGEREIRDTADALERLKLPHTEVLPLYARLSTVDQHKVFQPHAGRRIVLATNVAETSLTVPGIHYVVDPGTARISRFNRRTKVQRLPIEKVSRASADQRAGRCGRIAPGTCIRLYAEDDYDDRPEFTEPEILRTNLASVILQMTAIGLGDIAAFPFVDPPDSRAIKDGIDLLEELGALEEASDEIRLLTPIGRRLAQLPVDPRLGRMVLEADELGCVEEVMVIAAALSIQDPRERPAGKEQEAAELHRRFADDSSDFVSILNLWRYLQEQQAALGSSAFRRLCRNEHLHFLRVREWQDVFTQLRQVARSMRIHVGHEHAHRDHIHQALLSGLLSHVGVRDGERNEFTGARGARFALNPGSVLARKPPRWVMVAELVETNRLWGRMAARIQPEWVERLGAHLLTRSYGEPWWDATRGAAMTNERVSLYGIPVVPARRVQYGRIDPVLARDLFIRCALVEHDWQSDHAFVEDNKALVEQVRALEDRVRRRDILVDDDTLFDFFDERLPLHVISARHFDRWWKDERTENPTLLRYTTDLLVERDVDPGGFPDEWTQGELSLPLTYVFEPLAELDGVIVDIPLPLLNRVIPSGFDWHVPGYRHDLVTALIRALPKAVRRDLVPAAEHAHRFLEAVTPSSGPLLTSLERFFGVDGWSCDGVPDHLQLTFRAVDEQGRAIAWSKDLEALRQHLSDQVKETITSAAATLERTGLRTWPGGDLPRVVQAVVGGHTVKAFPALVDEGETVGVRTFTTQTEQINHHWRGTRRLLRLTVPPPARQVDRVLRAEAGLALAAAPAGVHLDIVTGAVEGLLDKPAWTEAEWRDLHARVKADLPGRAAELASTVARVLVALQEVEARLLDVTAPAQLHALEDISAQLGRLVFPGFVSAAGVHRIADVERYLRAIVVRLDALPRNPARDRELTERVQRLDALTTDRRIRWMIEELRVSLFAQSLGTREKVSETRILRSIEATTRR